MKTAKQLIVKNGRYYPLSVLTDDEILGLVNILAIWRMTCSCVVSNKVIKGPIWICLECRRPVASEMERD